jgi:hypothetical protein
VSGLADLLLLIGAPWLAALAVLLAPRRAVRVVAAAGAGVVLMVALTCLGGAPPVEHAWLGRGAALRLALGPQSGLGLVVTAAAGLLAVVEEERRRRGRLAGLLALQGVVLLALTAADLALVAAAWALAPALVLGLLMSRSVEAEGRVAGRALALFLSFGAGALLVAAAGLTVVARGASGGAWSAAIVELAAVRVPAAASVPIAAGLALAGVLALGLWPLHAGLVQGTAAGSRGTARLLAGPVRWLGLDALIRLWGPLAPLGAAATAPWLAGLATLGAIYAGLTARAEADPERRAARIGLVGWSVAALGVTTLAHEGLCGALLLAAVVGLGAPSLTRGGPLMRALVGLAGAVAGVLVVFAALRPAELTLGALGPWCACGAALALGLAGSALARGTGPGEHVESDMSRGEGRKGHVLADLSAAAVALALAAVIARPGPLLGRVVGAGEAWVGAIALHRCLALHDPRPVPTPLPESTPLRCESPLAGLRVPPSPRAGGGTSGG